MTLTDWLRTKGICIDKTFVPLSLMQGVPTLHKKEYRFFRLSLIKYYSEDPCEYAHDHSSDFYVIPLDSYIEVAYEPLSRNWSINITLAWKIYFREATYCHRVLGRWDKRRTKAGQPIASIAARKPFKVLIWHGIRKREWGYHKNGIWIPWREYGTFKSWVD